MDATHRNARQTLLWSLGSDPSRIMLPAGVVFTVLGRSLHLVPQVGEPPITLANMGHLAGAARKKVSLPVDDFDRPALENVPRGYGSVSGCRDVLTYVAYSRKSWRSRFALEDNLSRSRRVGKRGETLYWIPRCCNSCLTHSDCKGRS